MSNLTTKIKLYCEANSKTANFTENVLVWDNSDGSGQYIKLWNVSGLAQPTTDQLATYESTGDDEEADNVVRGARATAYNKVKDQLDQLYHDMTAGKLDATGEWYKAIKKVKDDNPKD